MAPHSARRRKTFRRDAQCLAAALLAAVTATSAAQGMPEVGTAIASPSNIVAQALALEHGEGVAKDLPKAAALYCLAAREGNPEAQFGLGWMYANGRGLPRDDATAAALFAMAAAAGHRHAATMLAFVGDKGDLPECMRPPAPTVAQPAPAVAPATPAVPESVVAAEPDPFAALSPAKRKIADTVGKLAPSFAIDLRLALAVIAVESNFQPAARSTKDARGLMQLIPETAARFNVKNPYDVTDNVRGGLAYLRWLLSYYQGEVALAVAAYNAGEKAVDRHRGIPPYAETRDYVRRILALYGSDRHPYDARIVIPSPFLASGAPGPS